MTQKYFSQYKENCEELIDCPTIGGGDIKDNFMKAIKNILNSNIYFHSRKLIAELPTNGVKCISKLQYNYENTKFSDRSRYDRLFQQV